MREAGVNMTNPLRFLLKMLRAEGRRFITRVK
jgi:hypothetical protein